MHGPEKSDLAIVAGKPANKAEQSAAESVERRAGTKGNAGQQSTFRTQSRANVSQALECIRQALAVTPEVGAVCGKAARTVLCGGRAMKRASLPLQRREFITVLGGAAATWSLAAQAQQGERVRRIGVLMAFAENDREYQTNLAAFREELQKLGWTEGRNIQIDYRWAGLDLELMRRYTRELIALQPDVILSSSSPTTASLLQETRSIPIIFANIADPVGSGLVASLSRPGGNATGFMLFEGS